MKKNILAIILGFAFLLVGCSSSNKADMSEYDLLTVKDHNFITGNYEEIVDKMVNKEPGIYYFGYPKCPWCRELVPVLQEVVNEAGLNVYYLNVQSSDWNLSLNNAVTEFGTQFETDLQYSGVPYVIFIGNDGKAIAHVGTVSSHNAYDREMTDSERIYLKRILNEAIDDVGLTPAAE